MSVGTNGHRVWGQTAMADDSMMQPRTQWRPLARCHLLGQIFFHLAISVDKCRHDDNPASTPPMPLIISPKWGRRVGDECSFSAHTAIASRCKRSPCSSSEDEDERRIIGQIRRVMTARYEEKDESFAVF